MVMKSFEYFKAEEKLIEAVYCYEAILKLKEGLVSLLDNQQGAEHLKIKKRYTKEIQKLQDLLSSTKEELNAMHEEYFGGFEEEKKEPLPDYISEMCDTTHAYIDDFNKNNETLTKMKVQIKELEKELAKIRKLTPEQLAELESFLKQLETIKDGLVTESAGLEDVVDELDNKALRGVGKLIDALDRHEKGYTPPKQMQ